MIKEIPVLNNNAENITWMYLKKFLKIPLNDAMHLTKLIKLQGVYTPYCTLLNKKCT